MKKALTIITNNLYLLLLILTTFVFAGVSVYNLKTASYQHLKTIAIIYLGICILISGFLIFTYSKKFKEKNIPYIFITLCIILGVIYIFASPLFTGSDEHNHYYRIYEITEGKFITDTKYGVVGSKLPRALKETFIIGSGDNSVKYGNIKDMIKVKIDKDDKVVYGNDYTDFYSNTALYSPVQYLPHIIGFSIGKIANFGVYGIGLLGRIFNLIFYALLGFLALKIIPKGKTFIMMILLSPNMLQCATTLSADAFTNAIFLLLISLIFMIKSKDKIISKWEELFLFLLSITIALCKIVYLPVAFLLLLIPKNKYKNGNKEKYIFCIITIAIAVFVSFLWMSTTNPIFDIAYQQAGLQKQFILNNIIEYLVIFIRTYIIYGFKYFECLLVGTTMYHTQLNISTLLSVFYNIIVILALLNDETKCNSNTFDKSFLALVSIAIIGLISTAIYIQCTSGSYGVGFHEIIGLQGRYFVPLLFVLPYLFKGIKIGKINLSFYVTTILFTSGIVWIYMIERFIF